MEGVREAVGEVHDVAFGWRRAAVLERVGAGAVVGRVVLGEALPGHVREVEAVELGVGVLQFLDDAERVAVVLEAAVVAEAFVEGLLAGVAEGGVAEVVGEGDDLRELGVQVEQRCEAARLVGDLQRVREPRAEVIALRRDEDLRLVLEPAERGRVHDALAIEYQRRQHVRQGVGVFAAEVEWGHGHNRPAGTAERQPSRHGAGRARDPM